MKQLRLVALLGAAAMLMGCGRDFSMDFVLLSKPAGASEIAMSFDRIQLEEGFAVAVQAVPLDNSDQMEWETQVELFDTGFDEIVRIERMEFDEDLEERKDRDLRTGDWNFVLAGAATGSTTMEVWIDGELEAEIPVFVNPQP